jgi:hypothetical protein
MSLRKLKHVGLLRDDKGSTFKTKKLKMLPTTS